MNERGYATDRQRKRISKTAKEYEVLLAQSCADSQAGTTVSHLHMLWMSRHIQTESRSWRLWESLRWIRLLQGGLIAGGLLRGRETHTPFSFEDEDTPPARLA